MTQPVNFHSSSTERLPKVSCCQRLSATIKKIKESVVKFFQYIAFQIRKLFCCFSTTTRNYKEFSDLTSPIAPFIGRPVAEKPLDKNVPVSLVKEFTDTLIDAILKNQENRVQLVQGILNEITQFFSVANPIQTFINEEVAKFILTRIVDFRSISLANPPLSKAILACALPKDTDLLDQVKKDLNIKEDTDKTRIAIVQTITNWFKNPTGTLNEAINRIPTLSNQLSCKNAGTLQSYLLDDINKTIRTCYKIILSKKLTDDLAAIIQGNIEDVTTEELIQDTKAAIYIPLENLITSIRRVDLKILLDDKLAPILENYLKKISSASIESENLPSAEVLAEKFLHCLFPSGLNKSLSNTVDDVLQQLNLTKDLNKITNRLTKEFHLNESVITAFSFKTKLAKIIVEKTQSAVKKGIEGFLEQLSDPEKFKIMISRIVLPFVQQQLFAAHMLDVLAYNLTEDHSEKIRNIIAVEHTHRDYSPLIIDLKNLMKDDLLYKEKFSKDSQFEKMLEEKIILLINRLEKALPDKIKKSKNNVFLDFIRGQWQGSHKRLIESIHEAIRKVSKSKKEITTDEVLKHMVANYNSKHTQTEEDKKTIKKMRILVDNVLKNNLEEIIENKDQQKRSTYGKIVLDVLQNKSNLFNGLAPTALSFGKWCTNTKESNADILGDSILYLLSDYRSDSNAHENIVAVLLEILKFNTLNDENQLTEELSNLINFNPTQKKAAPENLDSAIKETSEVIFKQMTYYIEKTQKSTMSILTKWLFVKKPKDINKGLHRLITCLTPSTDEKKGLNKQLGLKYIAAIIESLGQPQPPSVNPLAIGSAVAIEL